jgi:hypothetical protein
LKTFEKIDDISGHLKKYVNNRISSAKIIIAEKTSKVISNLVVFFIIIFLLFLVLIFASISLGFYLSKLTGSYSTGFLIIALAYLALVLLIGIFKEKLIRFPIMNNILQQILKEEEENEEN